MHWMNTEEAHSNSGSRSGFLELNSSVPESGLDLVTHLQRTEYGKKKRNSNFMVQELGRQYCNQVLSSSKACGSHMPQQDTRRYAMKHLTCATPVYHQKTSRNPQLRDILLHKIYTSTHQDPRNHEERGLPKKRVTHQRGPRRHDD